MQKLCECGCGQPAPISPATYKKLGYVKGKPRRFIKGHVTRGKKYSKEIAKKLAKNGKKTQFKKGHKLHEKYPWLKELIKPYQSGKKHWNWRGDKVGYIGIHLWLRKKFGKPFGCDICKTKDKRKKYEWSNISGKYKRDRKDFRSLCISCHRKLDYDKKR